MVGVLRAFVGGMGVAHLPDAGGILDQSVLMMSALNFMASFDQKLSDPKGKPLGEDGEVDLVEMERRAMASWGVL